MFSITEDVGLSSAHAMKIKDAKRIELSFMNI
jgi:hypothetical protein